MELCVSRAGACLQGEIFAAEGYAKVTGRVGVCIATSGPGATNLVTGLADAMLDSVPLVAITGQVRASTCASAAASARAEQAQCGREGALHAAASGRVVATLGASMPFWGGCTQVPRRMIGTDAFQETPIVEVTRSITKHNFLVMDIKDLPRVMKEAFYLARSGRPGAPLGGVAGRGCLSHP